MKVTFLALLGLTSALSIRVPGAPLEPWDSSDDDDAKYTRVIPSYYAADSDDIFMRSVITNYAQEQTDCDDVGTDGDVKLVNCKPTAVFTLNKKAAMGLAKEVLNTHKDLSGAELTTYMDTYFDKAWAHFDVMETGSIAADKAGALCRFLSSDQYTQFGESGFICIIIICSSSKDRR